MLSNIFNYDNPVWRFIGKFADLMILNLLWMICSIPIVTIGASTTAVYYVTLKLVKDEEGSTVKAFFQAFRENFKQATVIWLIMLVTGAVLGVDLYIFIMAPTTEATTFRTIMLALLGGLSIIWLAILLYVFPLQAKFYNPVKKTLFNACFISIRHLLQTIGILVIDVGLFLLGRFLLPILLLFYGLFGLPLFAFINSYFFTGIFDKYLPKDVPFSEESNEKETGEEA